MQNRSDTSALDAEYQDAIPSNAHVGPAVLDESVRIQSTQDVAALEKSNCWFSLHRGTMALTGRASCRRAASRCRPRARHRADVCLALLQKEAGLVLPAPDTRTLWSPLTYGRRTGSSGRRRASSACC